jgi:hypothetical protein
MVGGVGLVWRPLGLWHWLGTPPGWRRPWAEATCMAPADRDQYWVLRCGGRRVGEFNRAQIAMRFADHVWDAHAARRRL